MLSADVYDDSKVMVAEHMDMACITYPPMHVLSTCYKRVFASLVSDATQELNIVYSGKTIGLMISEKCRDERKETTINYCQEGSGKVFDKDQRYCQKRDRESDKENEETD